MEIKFLDMPTCAVFFEQVAYGKIEFHTESSQLNTGHDDSVVKTWYNDPDLGEEKACYGIIQNIIKHQFFVGGPVKIMVECEWLEEIDVGEENPTGLLRVRRNPNSTFNRLCRFTALDQCANYNIFIGRHNPWAHPDCELYNEYDVIDRWRTYEDHGGEL